MATRSSARPRDFLTSPRAWLRRQGHRLQITPNGDEIYLRLVSNSGERTSIRWRFVGHFDEQLLRIDGPSHAPNRVELTRIESVLKWHGLTLSEIEDASDQELLRLDGIGESTIQVLRAACFLARGAA